MLWWRIKMRGCESNAALAGARTSQNYPSETVWKIAQGSRARFFGGKKRPIAASLAPLERLRNPHVGAYPDFPNSFGRGILRSSAQKTPGRTCRLRSHFELRDGSSRLDALLGEGDHVLGTLAVPAGGGAGGQVRACLRPLRGVGTAVPP